MVLVIENMKKRSRVSILLFVFTICIFNNFSYSQNNKNNEKTKTTNSTEKELEEIDPELIELIKHFKKHIVMGNLLEAEELKQTIISITNDIYPDTIEKIQKALGEVSNKEIKTIDTSYKNDVHEETIAHPAEVKSSSKNNFSINNGKASDIEIYSDWVTFKNPYEALQVRYKLEKKEGDVGYFQAQFRINYDEPTICKDSRCLGYALCLGIPQLNNQDISYTHLKIMFPSEAIYTLSDTFPMKLSFPDGSKRMLKNGGFYYKVTDDSAEVNLQYFFIKSATSILQGSSININNFIESKAITLE